MATTTPLVGSITQEVKSPDIVGLNTHFVRVSKAGISAGNYIHSDSVYNTLFNAASAMEARMKDPLETYSEHPDVQANLQQLQYDLQMWNLALTTMTNINKNMGDALSSIASNFR